AVIAAWCAPKNGAMTVAGVSSADATRSAPVSRNPVAATPAPSAVPAPSCSSFRREMSTSVALVFVEREDVGDRVELLDEFAHAAVELGALRRAQRRQRPPSGAGVIPVEQRGEMIESRVRALYQRGVARLQQWCD